MKRPYNLGRSNFPAFLTIAKQLFAMKYDTTVSKVLPKEGEPSRFISLTPNNVAEKTEVELATWKKLLAILDINEAYLSPENMSRYVIMYYVFNAPDDERELNGELLLNLIPIGETVDLSVIPEDPTELLATIQERYLDEEDKNTSGVTIRVREVNDDGELVPPSAEMQAEIGPLLEALKSALGDVMGPQECDCEACQAERTMREATSKADPPPRNFDSGLN